MPYSTNLLFQCNVPVRGRFSWSVWRFLGCCAVCFLLVNLSDVDEWLP